MRRLALIGSWKRLGIQLGLLGGLGLAFASQSEQPAQAGGQCPGEGQCTFKKPNFMIVLDYSSSMNIEFDVGVTRWDAATDAIVTMIQSNNGFFDESMHFALMRFGHDPDPTTPGTTIANADPAIVDGQSLDIHWYDPAGDPSGYYECNGQAITDFLANVEDPLCLGVNCYGIGTWTAGAMNFATSIIDDTRADHPTDLDPGEERYYAVMLMTDGLWTDPDGDGMAPANDPAIPAGDLFSMDDVPTYVVAFGGAEGQAFVDQIATAGGTGTAIDASNPAELTMALDTVITEIQNDIIIPECTGGLPRIMIVLDASSSMLNVGGMAGAMGTTGWDQARDALVGANAIFDVEVAGLMQPVEDLVHLGLISFGHTNEQTVMVDYGPCMRDNFAWATDPNTSCDAGCNDPWIGPPITWTFLGPGDVGYPDFDQATYSRMPACNQAVDPDSCSGSGTYTHLGLQLANTNATAYRNNPPALYPVNPDTVFANILITDGAYSGYSTDAQVAAELTDMYANDDTFTYVIGFGDAISATELTRMACWGSGGAGVPACAGGSLSYYDANNQADLEAALQTIIESINFDPCCAFNDCSFNPEPTTNEPDPVPPPMETSSDGGVEESTGGSTDEGVSAETTANPEDTGLPEDTGAVDTTGNTTDPDGTGEGNTAEDSSGEGATASATDTNATDPTDTNDESGESSGSGGENTDDGGCGCSTDDDANSRGVLGAFFAFGLAGLARRRRRS